MNKICLLFVMLLAAGLSVFAQGEEIKNNSGKVSIAIGPEWNMNARENFAMGGVFAFDFNLGSAFALGVNCAFSSNFDKIMVLEPAAMFRWYFWGSKLFN